jgi:hypothetical protein
MHGLVDALCDAGQPLAEGEINASFLNPSTRLQLHNKSLIISINVI